MKGQCRSTLTEKDIRQEAIQGVRWSSLLGVSSVVLQLLQMVILARLLPPSDFGAMAILLVILGFSQCISDMGLSQALIQKKELHPRAFAAIFWVTLFMGGFISILVYVMSGTVAGFFNSVESGRYIRSFSAVFVIAAISS